MVGFLHFHILLMQSNCQLSRIGIFFATEFKKKD